MSAIAQRLGIKCALLFTTLEYFTFYLSEYFMKVWFSFKTLFFHLQSSRFLPPVLGRLYLPFYGWQNLMVFGDAFPLIPAGSPCSLSRESDSHPLIPPPFCPRPIPTMSPGPFLLETKYFNNSVDPVWGGMVSKLFQWQALDKSTKETFYFCFLDLVHKRYFYFYLPT